MILMLGLAPFVQQAVNTNGERWEQLDVNGTVTFASEFRYDGNSRRPFP